MALEINWEEILNELLCKADNLIEAKELVKGTRIKLGLSLSEFSEMTGVPESDLEAFEAGREIDTKNKLRIFMWFLEKEQNSVQEEDLKEKLRLAYLLCKLVLYGSDKQQEKFFKFIKSLHPSEE